MRFFASALFIIAIIIINFLDKPKIENNFDRALLAKSHHAIENINGKLTTNKYQAGTIKALTDSTQITEYDIQAVINEQSNGYTQKTSGILAWCDSRRQTITLSAMGLDWQHHFANSYLVGIRPFATENNWLPLYTISKLKTYQLDSAQYNTLEMWQNSAQAFMFPRGDCEDHALILADWLISEGVDAKVVVGTYKDGGHAWVVATIDQKDFLLEPTSKRVGKTWNHFPLASLATHYQAGYMFNRENFWVNTNKTSSYRTQDWLKTSIFTQHTKLRNSL